MKKKRKEILSPRCSSITDIWLLVHGKQLPDQSDFAECERPPASQDDHPGDPLHHRRQLQGRVHPPFSLYQEVLHYHARQGIKGGIKQIIPKIRPTLATTALFYAIMIVTFVG